nr:unnamed protein product [Spirometra erinaceieuropaei]
MLKLSWQDRIPDTDVLARTGILSINDMLRQLQLHWNGHLVRMGDERLPKRLFILPTSPPFRHHPFYHFKKYNMEDNPSSNRSERRTALVARELTRYKVGITALSETRLSDQGQLEEVGAGYTFFCGGRSRAERRDAGVAFALQNDIVG